MTDASWDDAAARWVVTTPKGTFTTKYLVTGTGHLADERFPPVPGIETFTGGKFHSARWDHSVPLDGKRIGVVGTGASAIQSSRNWPGPPPNWSSFSARPATSFRGRSGPTPRARSGFSAGTRPPSRSCARSLFWTGENTYAQRRGVPQYLETGRKMALDHLAAQVPDPELRARLTPDYDPGCKRVLISNTYYLALQAPVTRVEASALAEINGSTVLAASGNAYELDALVFATGFEATEPPFAAHVHGRDGLNLSEHWQAGMQAFD